MGRSPCCSKVGLRKGPWSTNEDKLLINYIQAHGEGRWRSLPKKAGLLRCGKSCRLRWINYLRPGIKRGNVTPDEEDLIIRLHSLLGNRWTLIARRLPGRTDNEIKNHWNTHIIKKLKDDGIESECKKNVAKIPNKSKKNAKVGAESNFIRMAKKHNNFTQDGSETADVAKIKIHVPKPIRAFPISSYSSNVESSISSSSSREQVNGEAIVNEKAKEKVPQCAWPLMELFEGIEHVGEDDDQLLIDGCCFTLKDSDPAISNLLEKVYDEYRQLL